MGNIFKRRKSGKAPGIGGYFIGQNAEAEKDADKASAAAIEEGKKQSKRDELLALQGEYANMPDSLLNRYRDDAKRAGTYSNTDDFSRGLTSERDAGLTGAYSANMLRQNALQRELGLEVTPYDSSPNPSAAPAEAAAAPAAQSQGLPASGASAPTTDESTAVASDEEQQKLTEEARRKAIQSELQRI